jgi:hypothetical protein
MAAKGTVQVPRARALVALCLTLAPAATVLGCGSSPVPEPAAVHRPRPIVGDYDMEIREPRPRADGIRHVDTPATIARLREAHVTTYFYLVFHAATDWADFTSEFLPAAEAAGIDLWVYLVPPSECCSQPHGTDFVRWAEEIARLSRRHPAIRGWAMDDFSSNLTTFTPGYTKAMRDAARTINPDLRFFPVLYHDDYSDGFLAGYAPYIDGAIFPYTVNFDHVDQLDEALDAVIGKLDPLDLDLVLMVYATKISVAEYPPAADYVAGALRVGLEYMTRGKILGVTTYAMAKEFQQEGCGFPRHLNLTVPSETATSAGDYVSASQAVRVHPESASYGLRFSEQDSYPIGTANYHFKQLLVDGQTVWDADVAGDPALSWVERSFDLTPYLKGKSRATLTFRLFDKKGVTNFGIRVSVANLDASGFSLANPDFTNDTGWTFAAQGPGSALYGHRACDPDRQRHVFEAVRDLYGGVAAGALKR